LLKLVRAPLLVQHFGLSGVVPAHTKVFLLVRAPWDVFMSQLAAGWFDDPHMPYAALVPAGVDKLEFNMRRICEHMRLNEEVLQQRPPEERYVLRYEDLVASFAAESEKLFGFLGIAVTEEMRAAFAQLSTLRFASFRDVPQSRVSRREAELMARRMDECRAVIAQYYSL
jgi:hypothetical protein